MKTILKSGKKLSPFDYWYIITHHSDIEVFYELPISKQFYIYRDYFISKHGIVISSEPTIDIITEERSFRGFINYKYHKELDSKCIDQCRKNIIQRVLKDQGQ